VSRGGRGTGARQAGDQDRRADLVAETLRISAPAGLRVRAADQHLDDALEELAPAFVGQSGVVIERVQQLAQPRQVFGAVAEVGHSAALCCSLVQHLLAGREGRNVHRHSAQRPPSIA
jgi:hypothetical protein